MDFLAMAGALTLSMFLGVGVTGGILWAAVTFFEREAGAYRASRVAQNKAAS
jgi:hypothetical protein